MMKKSVKIMVVSGILVIGIVFHKPLSLKAMDLVDYYGAATGKNVVSVIDWLNEIYYM